MQKFKVISFSYQYFSFLLVSTRNFTFAKVVFECHLKTKKTPKNQKPNPTPKQNTVQWLWSRGLPTLAWLRLSLHCCCPSQHHPGRHKSLEKQGQHDRSAERLEGRGSAGADELMALLLLDFCSVGEPPLAWDFWAALKTAFLLQEDLLFAWSGLVGAGLMFTWVN